MAFNPSEHLMQLKSKNGSQDYLEVKWRLVWFRTQCPEGEIVTEMVHLDLDRETEEEVYVWNNEKRRSEKIVKIAKGIAIFRATVKDGKGGLATGTKSEKAASFPDYIEKAESGSIGRALAALGYGTQFTGNELSEAHRIVDAPVDRGTPEPQGNEPPTQTTIDTELAITEQQIASIRTLSEYLGKPEPESINALPSHAAKTLIQQLTAEYRASKSTTRATTTPPQPVPSDEEAHRNRLVEIGKVMREKGLIREDAKLSDVLKECGSILGANVTALGHMTESRFESCETYVKNAKLAAVH